MTREEAIAIIRKEYLCVDRDCNIERSCGKCDLMMSSKEPILQAYKIAIKALKQEPCEDAISRQAVLDRIRESIETYHNQYTTDMLNMWGLFTQFIKEMPPVNPQPKTGHWIKQTLSVKPFGEDTVLCDQCAFMTDKDSQYNYCPNCGAKMQEVEE